ncbi:MAG: DUF1599 domain-containing protein [Bacteroidia bacterium]|nr:DUF1599 domain-containing protein [Bacteroidia bacterium]
MATTADQWRAVIGRCRTLYQAKAQDYGASWTVLRTHAILDQLYIKAKRIRTLELTGVSKVGEDAQGEFVGIVNYGLMALMLLEPTVQQAVAHHQYQPPLPDLLAWYDAQAERVYDTLMRKNHDYGEAWREMDPRSYTDMILVRVLRMKQIEANAGATTVSEGLEGNLIDTVNYAVFALIRHEESKSA